MASMEALLKIRADVQGEGQISKLGNALGGLNNTASKVSGGLKGVLGSVGGLSGALGALAPAVGGVGLVAMAQGAVNAADNMNDLAQKTGVSVEQLSRFQQAANASGTSIEAVGGAMIKLNRNLATKNEGAMKALESLGISATDASGKLKTTDQIMLEVAGKFAKLPDGAQKTAAAMALFGKSGADMIPMLNGGRESIEALSATMSTKFAKGADELNDKVAAVQGKLLQLGVTVGTALMPVMNAMADVVVAVANGFSALPGPVQGLIGGIAALGAAFVVLAPAISAAVSVAGALAGLQLGATIAGWLGVVGPAIAGITALFSGLLAFITGTLIPGLLAVFSGPVGWTVLAVAAVVAMVALFREPIMGFLSWLWENFTSGLAQLGQILYSVFVQPWVDLWNNVLRGPVTAMWEWLKGAISWGLQAAYAIAWQIFVQPWINLWNNVLREPIMGLIAWLGEAAQWLGQALQGLLDLAYKIFVQPWVDLWNNVFRKPVTDALQWINSAWNAVQNIFRDRVVKPITDAWQFAMGFLRVAVDKTAQFFGKVWTGAINSVKNVFRSYLTWLANGINSVIGVVNNLIGAFNRLPGPDIPLIGRVTVPAFAEGGFVRRPTLGLVGEAGSEYIIPASKMQAASERFLSGQRGADVLRPSKSSGRTTTASTTPPAINITTGPVLEFDGQRYVTVQDFERGMRMTAEGVIGRLRTPAARIALGR